MRTRVLQQLQDTRTKRAAASCLSVGLPIGAHVPREQCTERKSPPQGLCRYQVLRRTSCVQSGRCSVRSRKKERTKEGGGGVWCCEFEFKCDTKGERERERERDVKTYRNNFRGAHGRNKCIFLQNRTASRTGHPLEGLTESKAEPPPCSNQRKGR
jgi:hypothetical protein